MTWAELFAAAAAAGDPPSIAAIQSTLEQRRTERSSDADPDEELTEPARPSDSDADQGREDTDPDPSRVVADADVLAADLLRDDAARDALDHVRSHTWLSLVASPILLADAEAVIRALSTADLAGAWRGRVTADLRSVRHAPGDQPALASAAAGGAAHVLSFDDRLVSATGNLALQAHLRVSVRTPAAFDRLFDPERLYPAVRAGEYPGPDRDPRA